MRFRGRFSIPQFDDKKFSDKFISQIQVEQRNAARAWLTAVIPKVPVWAGTARGTLKPLGRFLRVAVPISPVVVKPRLGPEVGAAKSSFKFARRGKRFIFLVENDVDHFIRNNFHEAPNPPFKLKTPTPWNAYEAGQEAYEAYIKEVIPKKLPRIKDFIKYKTLVIE